MTMYGDSQMRHETFTFPQLFAVAATLKSIDYDVAMTFILNNNNNNNYRDRQKSPVFCCKKSNNPSFGLLVKCCVATFAIINIMNFDTIEQYYPLYLETFTRLLHNARIVHKTHTLLHK